MTHLSTDQIEKFHHEGFLIVNNIFDELYANNAWTYRYYSEGYDPRADDPYTNLNSDNSYSMSSYFPQAGRNYMLSLNIGL